MIDGNGSSVEEIGIDDGLRIGRFSGCLSLSLSLEK